MFCRVLFTFLVLSATGLAAQTVSHAHKDVARGMVRPVSDGGSDGNVGNGGGDQGAGREHGLSERSRKALEKMLNQIAPDLDVEVIPVPQAQEDGVDEPRLQPEGAPLPPTKPVFQLAGDLDGLLKQLQRTSDRRRAKRIENRIRALWLVSDSRSIDLLTHWARNALAERKYAVAFDLLDQVVTLRPDYAEGWNQRATLHYAAQDFGKSLADIERTLALEPRHFGAIAGLATILQQLDRKEEALAAWYRVLSVYPALQRAQEAVVALEEDLAGRGL